MKLIDSKTYLNLAKAYAGECQALVRYKFIVYGARQEGYEAMAQLVEKVYINEFNHARMFYTFIQTANNDTIENIDINAGYPFKEKWNLLDNLRLAAEDEENEATLIYPKFQRVAEEEGFPDIAGLYKNIIQVENCHKMLFTDLYNQLKTKTLYKKDTPVKWKCLSCGYEETGKEAWSNCPLCQAEQGYVLLKIQDNS